MYSSSSSYRLFVSHDLLWRSQKWIEGNGNERTNRCLSVLARVTTPNGHFDLLRGERRFRSFHSNDDRDERNLQVSKRRSIVRKNLRVRPDWDEAWAVRQRSKYSTEGSGGREVRSGRPEAKTNEGRTDRQPLGERPHGRPALGRTPRARECSHCKKLE